MFLLKRGCGALGLDEIVKDILDKKDQILEWIQEEKSKAFIAKQLNCKPDTLNKYLNEMGIKYNA